MLPLSRLVCPSAVTTVLMTVVLSGTGVMASSDDSWDEFRVEVENTCLNAAAGVLQDPDIVVDPYGSESYGIAVLSGPEVGGDNTPRILVCVFSKTTRTAEIGSTLEF